MMEKKKLHMNQNDKFPGYRKKHDKNLNAKNI